MKLRIISSGVTWETRVENAETGELLEGVQHIVITAPEDGFVTATIRLVHVVLGEEAPHFKGADSSTLFRAAKPEPAKPSTSTQEQIKAFAEFYNEATLSFQDRGRPPTPAQTAPNSPTDPDPDPEDPPHPA